LGSARYLLVFTLKKYSRLKEALCQKTKARDNRIWFLYSQTKGIGTMINRGNRGCSYKRGRGEILGSFLDVLVRRHSSRVSSLVKNERSVKTKVGRSKVSWVISSLGRPGERPDPKKPTARRGAVGVWNCESGDRIKRVKREELKFKIGVHLYVEL